MKQIGWGPCALTVSGPPAGSGCPARSSAPPSTPEAVRSPRGGCDRDHPVRQGGRRQQTDKENRAWNLPLNHTAAIPLELDDTDFARVLRHGAVIGVPLAFVVALLICLPGAGWPNAAAIAVLPAFMGGLPWIIGEIGIIERLSDPETPARDTHRQARPVTSPLGHGKAA